MVAGMNVSEPDSLETGISNTKNYSRNEPLFKFDMTLYFEGVNPKHPGRAMFSLHSKGQTKILQNLRDIAGPARLCSLDESGSTDRLRITENTTGLFIVQIRQGLSDVGIPKLNIDPKKRVLSLDWKELFNRFFNDRKLTEAISRDTVVYHPAILSFKSSPENHADKV